MTTMTDQTPAELAAAFTSARNGFTHAELIEWGDAAAQILADTHPTVVSRAVRVEWGTALRGADDEHGHPTIWDPVHIASEDKARAAAGPNADGTETIVPVWRIVGSDWIDASDEHAVTINEFVPRADYDEANDRANRNFDIVGEQRRQLDELTRDRSTLKAIRSSLADMTLSDAAAIEKIRAVLQDGARNAAR